MATFSPVSPSALQHILQPDENEKKKVCSQQRGLTFEQKCNNNIRVASTAWSLAHKSALRGSSYSNNGLHCVQAAQTQVDENYVQKGHNVLR